MLLEGFATNSRKRLRLRVCDIEQALFERFPRSMAEDWDKPGLSVGDPNLQVTHIACALDPTPANIRKAHELGCELLVTHHPAFLDAPFPMTPEIGTSSIGGASAYTAASLGVSLIAMHTNLDRSEAALDLGAELLGLARTGRLEEPDGYGALLSGNGVSLGELTERAASSFGCTPTVWGEESRKLNTVAFCSGSGGSFTGELISQGIDCVVTGEAGYHRISEAYDAGVAAILLGHDASERPCARLLADTLALVAPDTRIDVLDESLRWHAWGTGE